MQVNASCKNAISVQPCAPAHTSEINTGTYLHQFTNSDRAIQGLALILQIVSFQLIL